MARIGRLTDLDVDSGLIEAVNRVFVEWGWSGRGLRVRNGVLSVELSHPIMGVTSGVGVDVGWIKKKWKLKPSLAEGYLKSGDATWIVRQLMYAYFGKIMCHIRDHGSEMEWIRVGDREERRKKVVADSQRRGRRARQAGKEEE